MRKLIAMAMVAVVAVSVHAELLDWNWAVSANAPNGSSIAPGMAGTPLEGAGNFIEVVGDFVNSSSADGTTVGGYAPALTDWFINPFNFNARDQSEVTLVLYDAPTVGGASWFLESSVVLLPDNPDQAPPTSPIEFDFTGQEWQAIPEPATIGLMGIAGLGMFLARKKVRA